MNNFLVSVSIIYLPIMVVWFIFRLIHDWIVGPSQHFYLKLDVALPNFGRGRETEENILYALNRAAEKREDAIEHREYRCALMNCTTSSQMLEVIKAQIRQEYLIDDIIQDATDPFKNGIRKPEEKGILGVHPSRQGSQIVLWEDVLMFLEAGGIENNTEEVEDMCRYFIDNHKNKKTLE